MGRQATLSDNEFNAQNVLLRRKSFCMRQLFVGWSSLGISVVGCRCICVKLHSVIKRCISCYAYTNHTILLSFPLLPRGHIFFNYTLILSCVIHCCVKRVAYLFSNLSQSKDFVWRQSWMRLVMLLCCIQVVLVRSSLWAPTLSLYCIQMPRRYALFVKLQQKRLN